MEYVTSIDKKGSKYLEDHISFKMDLSLYQSHVRREQTYMSVTLLF